MVTILNEIKVIKPNQSYSTDTAMQIQKYKTYMLWNGRGEQQGPTLAQ